MKKISFLLLCCFCNLSVWAQENQLRSTGNLVQDSVRTRIVNGKPETIFYVKATASESFPISFWLMGVRHVNGTYSIYTLKVDNDSIGQVLTDRGDWHSYRPSNINSVYLTQGSHTISISGTLNDVPNAECVKKHTSLPYGGEVPDTTRYAYRKLHQGANFDPVSFITDTLLTNYRVLNFKNYPTNPNSFPVIQYNAELNKDVFYSFFRLEYFTENQVVTLETSGTNLSHVLNLFAKESTANYSWVAFSNTLGSACLNVVIPQSGFYYVLIRTSDPTQFGTCNLCINSDMCFDNVPICSSVTEIQHPYSLPSSCFATSNNGDPFICLIRDNGDERVFAYNDDYPFNSSISVFDWKKNARINTDSCNHKWLFTTTKSYPAPNIQKCDIYVGCKKYMNGSPFYMNEDGLISDDPATSGSYYNCISWSVGVWHTWINPKQNKSQFDAFYAGYGYYPSDSVSAEIDLWKNGTVYEHASVKSKGHQFAASYDWESKLGQICRVFHPRNVFQGGNYGIITAHYKKDSNNGAHPGPGPFFDFSFSSSEMTEIENGIIRIPNNIRESFWNLYNEYQNDSSIIYLSDTRFFDRAHVYGDLLNYCIDNPSVVYYLFKEASKRSVFPLKLLQDIAKHKNPELLTFVEETYRRIYEERTDKPLRNVQADEILLSRALLSGATSLKEVEDIAKGNASYSNDHLLSVSLQGQTAHVSFDLNETSQVILILVNMNSFEMKKIIRDQYFEAGSHKTSFNISTPGLYSIGLMVNGGIFEKKFKVER